MSCLNLTFAGIVALLTLLAPGGRRVIEEKYPSGELKSTSEVTVDGSGQTVTDGVTTTYFKDGKKATETTYRRGRRNGLATEWHPNGQKKSETEYHLDRPEGV